LGRYVVERLQNVGKLLLFSGHITARVRFIGEVLLQPSLAHAALLPSSEAFTFASNDVAEFFVHRPPLVVGLRFQQAK
jgi:hypothetical protein